MIQQNPMPIILISVFFFFGSTEIKTKIVMKWYNWHPKDGNGTHQGYTTAVLILLYSRVCFHSVSTQYMSVPESRKKKSVPKTFFMLQWQLLFCITCTIDSTWFSGPKKHSWIRTESKMKRKYAYPKSAHLSACTATIHTESICSQNKGHSLLKKIKSKNRGTSSNKLLVTSYILKIFKKNSKFTKHVHARYSYTVYKLANKVNWNKTSQI